MKFGRDLKIVSENQIQFATGLKDEAKSFSQDSESQGEDDIYSNPEFFDKIDEIVETALKSKQLASDLDQFDKQVKPDNIVSFIICYYLVCEIFLIYVSNIYLNFIIGQQGSFFS